jgi:hypothetical protein
MTPTRSAMYAGYDIIKDFLTKSTSLQERWVVALAGMCVWMHGVRGVYTVVTNKSLHE